MLHSFNFSTHITPNTLQDKMMSSQPSNEKPVFHKTRRSSSISHVSMADRHSLASESGSLTSDHIKKRRMSLIRTVAPRRFSLTLSSGLTIKTDEEDDDDDDDDSVVQAKIQFPRASLRYLPRILRESYVTRQMNRPTTMSNAELAQLDLRLRLRRPKKLPYHRDVRGTVLILDMSGFTALGERLRSELGPREGAAEFATTVNNILSAMVGQVYNYGGDVILFAGDALVCLFREEENSNIDDIATATLQKVRECCLMVLGEVSSTGKGNFSVHGGAVHGVVRCFFLGRPSIHPGDCQFVMSGLALQRAGLLLDRAGRGEVRIDGLGTQSGFLTENEGKKYFLQNKRQHRYSRRDSKIWETSSCLDNMSLEQQSLDKEEADAAISNQLPLHHIDKYDVHPFARAYISKLQARRRDNDAQNVMSILNNELRPVAIVFLGLRDFDDIDASDEGSIQLMNDCFISLTNITQSCNGTVRSTAVDDKGCVFISVFGAHSHEINPCFDATVCALRMKDALKNLKIEEFSMGVSFGDCFCGEVGPAIRSDFVVMGPEVNMAARLKGKAPNHGILVSKRIHTNSHQDINFSKTSEKINVKGKNDSFYAYIPISRVETRKAQSTLAKGQEQPFIPMPSRQVQVNQMLQALNEAKNGTPSCAFVCSAPFLGKSRMIEEVAKKAQLQGFLRLQSFRTTLDSFTSYFPFRQIVSKALKHCAQKLLAKEFTDDLEALKGLINNKVLNKTDRVVMGSILPSLVDSQLTSLLSGQNAVVLTKSIAMSLFKIFIPIQPLVMIFEGEGELDPSSCALLSQLLETSGKSCPHMLIYLVVREVPSLPVSASTLRSQAQIIRIIPYEKNETEIFIKGYLGIRDGTVRIHKKLLDVVYDRSNGCPTFIEYVLRWAIDKDVLEYIDGGRTLTLKTINDPSSDATATIPREISNIVLAAFNNVSPVLWDALKIASCVGYSFDADLYGELSSLNFMPRIKELASNHDVFERSGGNRYKWKQNAIFEAVHSLLMGKQRVQIHNVIVQAFEEKKSTFETMPQFRDEIPRILARHCSLAELWEGAYNQFMQAGQCAEQTYKFSEATKMYEEAIAVLDRLMLQNHMIRSQLLPKIKLGNCLRELAIYGKAQLILTMCLAEAEKDMANDGNDEKMYVHALTSLAVLNQAQSNYSKAKELYEKALPIARQIQSSPSSLWLAGIIAGYAETLRKSGDLPLAEKLHKEALEIRDLASQEGACTELELAVSYTQLGCTQQGMKRYEEAYAQHRSALNCRVKYLDFSHGLVSESLNYTAESLSCIGKSQEGVPLGMHAVEIRKAVFGKSHPALAHALSILAGCYHKSGRSHDAIGFLEQCLDICETAFHKTHANLIPNLMNFGDVLKATGDYEKARQAYIKAAEIHEMNFKEGQKRSQIEKCKVEIKELTQLANQATPMETEPHPDCATNGSPTKQTIQIPTVDVHDAGTPIIILTDIGRDTDDELALVLLASLKRMCLLNPIAVVTTLAPQKERAYLARGALDVLGLLNVPVGVGSAGGTGIDLEFYGGKYARPSHSLTPDGVDLMVRALKASPDRSVQLLVIASFTDAAILLRDHKALCVEKMKEIVVMGGLQPLHKEDMFIKPDSAYNNNCDMPAAQFVYQKCQELGIPTVTLSRWAAYGAPVSTSLLDNIAGTDHMVGINIRDVSENNITELWNKVNFRPSDPRREKLPERCDRSWFCKTFTDVDELTEDSLAKSSIWQHVTKLNIYDPLALLSCVPAFREAHFRWETKMVNGVPHVLTGFSKENSGIVDVDALQQEMSNLFLFGLNSALKRGR